MNYKALFSLIGLLTLALFVVRFHGELMPFELNSSSATLLSVALMLLGGWLTGLVFSSIKLPRICGYLLFGIIIGPSQLSLNILTSVEHVQNDLKFINHLAVSLIALIAGGEIKFEWLRKRLRQVTILIFTEATLVIAISFAVSYFTLSYLPFFADQPKVVIVVAALFVSLIFVSKSPMVSIAIINDYKAKGELSQLTLSMTVATDMLVIALFTTAVVIGNTVLDENATLSFGFILAILVQLLGSILFGVIAGATMALYVEKYRVHLGVFVVGCCLLFAIIGEYNIMIAGHYAHLEPLLAALVAGIVMENIYPESSTPLFHRIERLSLPVYCLFFSLAGAKIDLDVLINFVHIAIIFALLRALIIAISTLVAVRCAGITESWKNFLWVGSIPQAGVSLVLVTVITTKFSHFPWASQLGDLLIGMIVCNELFGPIGFRWILYRFNEVKLELEA